MPEWGGRGVIDDEGRPDRPASPWRMAGLVTLIMPFVIFVYVRFGYPSGGVSDAGLIVLSLAGTVVLGLLVGSLLMLTNRTGAVRARQEQAVLGVDSPHDWSALNRALRTGEPPANPALDGPLRTLVRRRRAQVRTMIFFWIVAVFGAALAVSGAAIGADRAEIFRQTFSLLLVAVGGIYATRVLRRLSRLEKRLQSRTPRWS